MKVHDLHLQFSPVTKKRWADFETLFGERGACGGCWCMLWRLTRKEFESQKGAGNREAMKAIIEAGQPLPSQSGIFVYAEECLRHHGSQSAHLLALLKRFDELVTLEATQKRH